MLRRTGIRGWIDIVSIVVLGAVVNIGRADDGRPAVMPNATQATAFDKSTSSAPECPCGTTCCLGNDGICCCPRDPCCDGWGATVFSTVNGFKGPTDVDGNNGDFGASVGANLGFALLREAGIGFQAGTSLTVSDFRGTPYTGARSREQEFTTMGFFHNADCGGGWNGGAVYDLLDDDYFVDFHFGQVRAQLGYQFQCNDIGVSFTVPVFGTVTSTPALPGNRFEPFSQILGYWQHTWATGTTTEFRLGAPTDPNAGELILGASATCPLNCRTGLMGGFSYVAPTAPGSNATALGRSGEVWSLYTGIAIALGPAAREGCPSRFSPLLPVADQGSMGITRIH
jgi:hypothetical protein